MGLSFIDAVRAAHTITCPVCGRTAGYAITGANSYETDSCHDKLSDLIDAKVKLLLHVKDSGETNKSIRFK